MSYPSHITNIYELLNEDGAPQSVRVNTGDQSKSTNQTARGAQGASSTRGNAQGGAKPQGARDGQRRAPRQDNRGGRSIDGRKPNEVPVGGDFSQEAAPFRRDRGERTRDSAHKATDRRVRGADQVGEFGGKRVFDRRSGTGRGREQKKSGAGRGNWGKEGEENQEGNWDTEEPKTTTENQEEKVEVVPEKTPEQEERERLAREEEEKEAKLLTLDDYFKQKEATAVKIDLPQARKANEGVDQKELSKWGAYSVLKKDDDDESVSKKEAREKSAKSTVPIDQVFNVREAPRPREDRPFREGRGGRGGSRGGRGGNRGGNRGSGSNRRGGENAPNFDLNSFPTLAPKA